eukprot:scaffold14211_cov54-Attheya_sp.AAC.1
MTTAKSTDSLVPIDGSKRPRSYQSIESVLPVDEEGHYTNDNDNDEQQCDEDARSRKRTCIMTSYGKRWVGLGMVWVCFAGAALRWGGPPINISNHHNMHHSFQVWRGIRLMQKHDSYVPRPPQYWMDLSHAYTSLYLLQSRMVGDVIFPYDKRFRESSNIWNRNVGAPLAVVQAANEADVQQALPILSQLYLEHDVSFRIKSGGHSYAGYSGNTDGIILSVAKLNTLNLNLNLKKSSISSTTTGNTDTVANVVTMGPGTIVQQLLDQALLPYGLGGVVAECSGVAQGGFVTGGGYGFLSRKYGLGVDNVRGFRVVLLDGTAITANQTLHPDLYWALRGGGGGNFGIVTSIEYQLYPSIQDTQLFVSGTIPLEVIPRFLTQLGHLESSSSGSSSIPGEFSFLLKGPITSTVSIPFTIGWIGTDDGGVGIKNHTHTHHNTTEGESYIQNSIASLVPEAKFEYDYMSWSNRTRQEGNSRGNLVRAWSGFLYDDRNNLEVWTEISNLLGAVAAKCPYLHWHVELWGGAISNVAPQDTAFYYRDA